jgi:NTP pyrophosphatase (non-canonical NTP hydrolase)
MFADIYGPAIYSFTYQAILGRIIEETLEILNLSKDLAGSSSVLSRDRRYLQTRIRLTDQFTDNIVDLFSWICLLARKLGRNIDDDLAALRLFEKKLPKKDAFPESYLRELAQEIDITSCRF